MRDVYICDAIRTPIGRFGGGLSAVRADDLAAVPIKALMERNPSVDWNAVDEVFLGCANQAGEDNRNVARMALLLAGLPESIPGVTLNRLCASGMDAVGTAFRAIASGEMELAIAGGVESMSRAPFVMGKADSAFSRNMKLEDTTIGWRFINPLMKAQYGVDAMPQTADNVADDYAVSRADQDAFALRSQQRTAAAQAAGFFAEEIVPVRVAHKKGETVVEQDEHPRADTTLETLSKLKPVNGPDKTVTAGNASGVNDGAAALILASAEAVKKHGLTPRGKVLGMARGEAEAIAVKQLNHVGLGDKLKVYPGRLSGGQQQRMAIARALAMNPAYMLFDEVTSALDPQLVGEVLDTLKLLADEGMTMICVTHEMGFARDVSNRVAFFHKGILAEVAAPKEFFGAPQHPETQKFLASVR